MGTHSDYADKLRALMAQTDLSDRDLLAKSIVIAAKWRTALWVNTLAQESLHIRSGPFEGMNYVVHAAEGALLPRLLGVYERELHPALEALRHVGLQHVIDIGCAEGYYAVGLARLMPGVTVNAYDTNEAARRRCRILAEANGVVDQVVIREEFRGEEFARFAGSRALVFIDAEGFEDEVLRPDLYPALAGFDLIVETHPMYREGVTERLIQRFEATHEIDRINPSIEKADLLERLTQNSHLDMLLATWEWRSGPTPWLVMRPRSRA